MTKSKKHDFRPNEFVVYPAHGVGQILSIEEQEVAGISLELFVISFEKDKMTLRVPTHKATEIGMRALSSPDVISHAMKTLKGAKHNGLAGLNGNLGFNRPGIDRRITLQSTKALC